MRVSLPDIDLSPDQFSDAVHDDALALLHETNVESPRNTLEGFADIDAAAELLGGVKVLLLPSPPPPQPVTTMVVKIIARFTL